MDDRHLSTENLPLIGQSGAGVAVPADEGQRDKSPASQLRYHDNTQGLTTFVALRDNTWVGDVQRSGPERSAVPTNAPSEPSGRNTCSVCGASFTATDTWRFFMNHFPRCRQWKIEWEPKNYTTDRGKIKIPPHWMNRLTWQPDHAPGWLVIAQKVQDKRNERMKKGFFVDGVDERSFSRGQQWEQRKAEMTKKQADDGVRENMVEEGEVLEGEDGAYSPANAAVSASIVDQADALIAEERGRLPR